MAYELYSIKQYLDARFKKDYSVISKEDLKLISDEYVDTARLYNQEYLEKISYIYFINSRLNSIEFAIEIQTKFLNDFGKPFEEGFNIFKKYSHKLIWNGSKDDFLNQLKKVSKKESRNRTILVSKVKELEELKKKDLKIEEESEDDARKSFIRTLNSLGKIGYRIDKNETTLEELSLMILQQKEENEKNV